LFSVVQFENKECSGSKESETGVCYTEAECNDHGGAKIGNCASGFGVCCMVKTSTCGSTVQQNSSFIQNPSHPSKWAPAQATNCVYNVKPCNNNICQMRLEFLQFEVSGKAATGACGTNTMAVNGGTARDISGICGTLTGQHLYIDNGRATADTVITFTQQGAGSAWNIRVLQIECDNSMRAPDGCLQYYTGAGGKFTSLGRGDNLRMLQFSYNICFRREANMCAIDYKASTAGSFDLGNALNANDNKAIAGVANLAMAEAALSIPGAPQLWYGGERLANTNMGTLDEVIRATTIPFTVRNVGTLTDRAAGQVANKGFDISWNQVPCAN